MRVAQALTPVEATVDQTFMFDSDCARAAGAFCAGAWIVVTTCISGCSGSGANLDENGRPAGATQEPLVAQFDSIQRNVLTPVCTGCHAGATAPLGLRLEEGAAYGMLVGVPSVEVPARLRVSPGDPDGSYLVQKIEGTAAVGGRMPLNAPALDSAMIQVIRQWILDGAQPPASTSFSKTQAHPATLQALWPMQDAQLTQPPAEILLAADTALDTSLLHAGTVRLTRGSDPASMRSGATWQSELDHSGIEPLNCIIEARSMDPTTIAILPDAPWLPGTYELRISGTAPLAITDLAARPIDGDADGEPGGDYVLRFTLEDGE